MTQVDAWLAGQDGQARMIMQVHDELVFECDEGFVPALREAVTGLMAGAAHLSVPLLVDCGVGDNWEQAH